MAPPRGYARYCMRNDPRGPRKRRCDVLLISGLRSKARGLPANCWPNGASGDVDGAGLAHRGCLGRR